MSTCSADMMSWWGWVAGFAGALGSLLLVRPLFLFLQLRESIEALGHALDNDIFSREQQEAARAARRDLGKKIFKNRHKWKRWIYGGLALLTVALLALIVQFFCMI